MKSMSQKIIDKGVTKMHVAKMVGIAPATLSRILSGEQRYTSDEITQRIHTYLDALNTDDQSILADLKK